MPNQRKANKRKLGVWLTDTEKELLEEKAKDYGFDTVTDFLKWVATEMRGANQSERRKKGDK